MVKLRYSGGTTNRFPITSIGGGISDTEIPDAELGNLFDDVTRVEVINGRTEYRCFFILNDTGTDHYRVRLKNLVVPTDAEISFAVDPSVVPQQLITEDSTPVGLTFYKFREWNELEIAIGLLDQTKQIAIWIKRKVLLGSTTTKMIDFNIDGGVNSLTITQDFNSVFNALDNDFVTSRSTEFFTDEDFCGESLLS